MHVTITRKQLKNRASVCEQRQFDAPWSGGQARQGREWQPSVATSNTWMTLYIKLVLCTIFSVAYFESLTLLVTIGSLVPLLIPWKMPAPSQLILFIFQVLKLLSISSWKSQIQKEDQNFHIWRTSSATGCFKNKYSIPLLSIGTSNFKRWNWDSAWH